MQGTHYTADCYGCSSDLANLKFITNLCSNAITDNGLNIVGESWTKFPDWEGHPGGITGALVLAESHLAIHTWPETGNVTIDIYVCNFTKDNSGSARVALDTIINALSPNQTIHNSIERGNIRHEVKEYLTPNTFFGTKCEVLHKEKSEHQDIVVAETDFGKTLIIDGVFMTSEKDEFIYHEAMAQLPILCKPLAKSVVIVGGGDGGAAREVLKMGKSPTILELDSAVVDVSTKYLGIDHGALMNHKTNIIIGDALESLKSLSNIDILVLDLTDPNTPAFELYSEKAFTFYKSKMSDDGILTMHLGSPVHHPERVSELYKYLKSAFNHVQLMGAYIPMYGAYWMMAMASDSELQQTLQPHMANKFMDATGLINLTHVPKCHIPNNG